MKEELTPISAPNAGAPCVQYFGILWATIGPYRSVIIMYTIRDIGLLTAYCALILAPSALLVGAAIVASLASTLIIGFVFVPTTLGFFFSKPQKIHPLVAFENATQRFGVPLLLLLGLPLGLPIFFHLGISFWNYFCWTIAADIGWRLPVIKLHELPIPIIPMLVGVASASLPVLFILDSHRLHIGARMLRIGYWGMAAGMISAAIVFNLQFQMIEWRSLNESLDILRMPALAAICTAAIVCWLVAGKSKQFCLDQDTADDQSWKN